jgi:hypothetical protein
MHAFSPKNPIFCTFLQGGGTTFWQAQKRGFWGVRGSRERPRPRQNFASKIHPTVAMAASQHSDDDEIVMKVKNNFRQVCVPHALLATAMDVGN